MKNQIVYETNVDYERTYDNLCGNPSLKVDKTRKGHIWFMFKNLKTVFMISPYGKMQVKWNDPEEKKTLLKLVDLLLVSCDGQKVSVKPTKQQVWIRYPAPEPFKLYWCEEETEYSKCGIDQKNVEAVLKELKAKLGRAPTNEEVAREIYVDTEDQKAVAAINRARKKLGIKEPSKNELLESQLPFLREEDMRGE